MNPLNDPEDLGEATRLINSWASSDFTRWIYTEHARDRLKQRQISNALVELTLREGVVVGFRSEVVRDRLLHKYEAEYWDDQGRLTVVTAVASGMKLIIVTAYTDIPD